jgi:hypothetical protein
LTRTIFVGFVSPLGTHCTLYIFLNKEGTDVKAEARDQTANSFLTSKAMIDVPINVALQYNHRLSRTPETKAGASERAGFIDAPDINARKNISSDDKSTISP